MIRRVLIVGATASLFPPLWRVIAVWPRLPIGDPFSFALKLGVAAVWCLCSIALGVLALIAGQERP